MHCTALQDCCCAAAQLLYLSKDAEAHVRTNYSVILFPTQPTDPNYYKYSSTSSLYLISSLISLSLYLSLSLLPHTQHSSPPPTTTLITMQFTVLALAARKYLVIVVVA
jgi:hypothetical protein